MKAQDYRQMSADELRDRHAELRRNLFELKSQFVTETVENSKALLNARRNIARIMTVMREKQE